MLNFSVPSASPGLFFLALVSGRPLLFLALGVALPTSAQKQKTATPTLSLGGAPVCVYAGGTACSVCCLATVQQRGTGTPYRSGRQALACGTRKTASLATVKQKF